MSYHKWFIFSVMVIIYCIKINQPLWTRQSKHTLWFIFSSQAASWWKLKRMKPNWIALRSSFSEPASNPDPWRKRCWYLVQYDNMLWGQVRPLSFATWVLSAVFKDNISLYVFIISMYGYVIFLYKKKMSSCTLVWGNFWLFRRLAS